MKKKISYIALILSTYQIMPCNQQRNTIKRQASAWSFMRDIDKIEANPKGSLEKLGVKDQKIWEQACLQIAKNEHLELKATLAENNLCKCIYACTEDPQKIDRCTITDVTTLLAFAIKLNCSSKTIHELVQSGTPLNATYTMSYNLPISDQIAQLSKIVKQPIFQAIEHQNIKAFKFLLPHWDGTREPLRKEITKKKQYTHDEKTLNRLEDMLKLTNESNCMIQ